MTSWWNKFKKSQPQSEDQPLSWDEQAKTAINQAIQQAPVPPMLKGRLRKELEGAAESEAQKTNRKTVTAEDVMNGLLSKLPANMRQQVEEAMRGGPDALKKLQGKLRGQK
ncbi:MAG: hypothetical protein PHU92_03580 [Candidatus Shapirobacteria bacterium]|nr:hypothetical protein [Candidatus Shapirobacteria bacterium]